MILEAGHAFIVFSEVGRVPTTGRHRAFVLFPWGVKFEPLPNPVNPFHIKRVQSLLLALGEERGNMGFKQAL